MIDREKNLEISSEDRIEYAKAGKNRKIGEARSESGTREVLSEQREATWRNVARREPNPKSRDDSWGAISSLELFPAQIKLASVNSRQSKEYDRSGDTLLYSIGQTL